MRNSTSLSCDLIQVRRRQNRGHQQGRNALLQDAPLYGSLLQSRTPPPRSTSWRPRCCFMPTTDLLRFFLGCLFVCFCDGSSFFHPLPAAALVQLIVFPYRTVVVMSFTLLISLAELSAASSSSVRFVFRTVSLPSVRVWRPNSASTVQGDGRRVVILARTPFFGPGALAVQRSGRAASK